MTHIKFTFTHNKYQVCGNKVEASMFRIKQCSSVMVHFLRLIKVSDLWCFIIEFYLYDV